MLKILLAAIVATALSTVCAMGNGSERLDQKQSEALRLATMARIAGEDGHCPRYQVMMHSVYLELADGGITTDMFDTDNFKNAYASDAELYLLQYNRDPSDFCLSAWRMLGPRGTYKRQMLEPAG